MKLTELLNFLNQSNKYYKQYKNADSLMDYPVLTRKTLQDNRFKLFSKGYQSKYFNGDLLKQSSSGTTGQPVVVYWDYRDWFCSNLPLWRLRQKWYQILPSDKHINFCTVSGWNDSSRISADVSSEVLEINTSLLRSDTSYYEALNICTSYKPKWIFIPPSVLIHILNLSIKNHIPFPKSIEYIELVSEFIDDTKLDWLREYLKIPIARMYGSEEMNGIAFECPNHMFHVLGDNVLLEVLTKEGTIEAKGKGLAIVTNLCNKAMPLIRYSQDDMIQLEEPMLCDCGEETQIISKIYGRKRNIILLDEEEITESFLCMVVSCVNTQFHDAIIQFRFLYDSSKQKLDCFFLLSVGMDKWKDSIICEFKAELLKQLHRDSLPFEISFPDCSNSWKSIIEVL